MIVELINIWVMGMLMALSLAAFSYLYQWLMWEGNILEWWANKLHKWNINIAKPLGLCIFCFNVHFSLIVGWPIAYYILFQYTGWAVALIWLILLPLFSNLLLRILMRYEGLL